MHKCDICLEVAEGVEADITVYFLVYSPGVIGDYWTESEGPEFEIEDIDVNVLYGSDWEKTGRELDDAGWYEDAVKICLDAIDNYPDLYETQSDAYYYPSYE